MRLFLIKQSLKRIPHYYLPLSLFFLFSLVISPFSSSEDASRAGLGRGGRGHSWEGTVGPGEQPTAECPHVQKSSSGFTVDVVRNLPVFGARGRVLRAPWEEWATVGVF